MRHILPLELFLLPRALCLPLSGRGTPSIHLSRLSSQFASRPLSSCPRLRWTCSLLFFCSTFYPSRWTSTHLLLSPKPIPLDHNSLLISTHLFQLLEEHLLFEVPESPQSQSLPFSLILYPSEWHHQKSTSHPDSLLSAPQSQHLCVLKVTTASFASLLDCYNQQPNSSPPVFPPWRSRMVFIIHRADQITPLLKRRSLASCNFQDNVQIP